MGRSAPVVVLGGVVLALASTLAEAGQCGRGCRASSVVRASRGQCKRYDRACG
eukprot:COSAG02_NODE_2990_length_7607_cov_3.437134_6_plen_53_part_00